MCDHPVAGPVGIFTSAGRLAFYPRSVQGKRQEGAASPTMGALLSCFRGEELGAGPVQAQAQAHFLGEQQRREDRTGRGEEREAEGSVS